MDEGAVRRWAGVAEALTLRTGRALFYQGDPARRCFLVLSGAVRSVMYRSDETRLDLGTQGPGDWLGLAELVLDGPYLTDAVALDGCRVLAFDRGTFTRMRALVEVGGWLVAELARRTYALHSRIEVTQPGQRLARWLADRVAAGEETVRCTQEELAAAVGCTRETVNRHLARLQAEGLVKTGRGTVTVLNPGGLGVWSAD